MGVSLSLPRSLAVTEELLSPVPDLPPEALPAVLDQLVGTLGPLAAEIPPGQKLVLDAYRLALARRHPERCAAPEPPFAPSPATCRRAVGLAAVDRLVRARAAAPVQAVAEVLAAGAEDALLARRGEIPRAPWWAPWYASLGEGGRAAVAAEAVTWATQLWTALAWDRFAGPVVVGGHDDWWDLPGSRALTLRGRVDVRARVGPRAVLVVVGTGIPRAGHRNALAFAALVAALAAGGRAVPGRVLGLWPASGQVRVVPLDAPTLARCAEEVVATVAVWVDGLLERTATQAPPGTSERAGARWGT